jgi:glutaredoxin
MANNYYLQIVYLENCPYSQSALKLLDDNNIQYKRINVSYNDKDKYKTELISTFPQIYLKKQGKSDSLLLGGRDDINNIYNKLKFNSQTIKNNINDIRNQYNFSKKTIVRLIELLN